MRLIPKQHADDYDFKRLFGNRNFLSDFSEEGAIQTYAFNWNGDMYELRDEELGKNKCYTFIE